MGNIKIMKVFNKSKPRKAIGIIDSKVVYSFILTAIVILIFSLSAYIVYAASSPQATVCCERTKAGAWCQNTLPSNCDASYSQTPSSCDATSFCKLGTCYDSTEGTCAEKTSQKACQESGGVWSDNVNPDEVPQCQTGCCVLGEQAAFTTLTRCKKLSSFYALETDFRKNIGSEAECISLTQAKDEGACAYEQDFIKTCKFTTRSECTKVKESTFYKDFLCSADELATNCGPTTKTTTLQNKDEVYFIDSCGNRANIYDASKVNDKAYWRKLVPKEESCNPDDPNGNANSPSCGNCQYLAGSMAKDYRSTTSKVKPTYGNYICQDLDCSKTFNGKDYKHGESWCVNDNNKADEESVGSRHYRHVCIAGEEIVEPCADFRQEVCVEDKIETTSGEFSQAGCRVNRWQDCTKQKTKGSCEDLDKRDCKWNNNLCVPSVSPGLNFWGDTSGSGSKSGSNSNSDKVCRLANELCVVEFETKLLGGEKCIKNCECLDNSWLESKKSQCSSLGDCGTKVNVIKVKGRGKGFSLK